MYPPKIEKIDKLLSKPPKGKKPDKLSWACFDNDHVGCSGNVKLNHGVKRTCACKCHKGEEYASPLYKF